MTSLALPRRIGLLEERRDHAVNGGQRKRAEMLQAALIMLGRELIQRECENLQRFRANTANAFSRS